MKDVERQELEGRHRIGDQVELRLDVPEENVSAGAMGIVVHEYNGGEAYSVSFVNERGELAGIVTGSGNSFAKVDSAVTVRKVEG